MATDEPQEMPKYQCHKVVHALQIRSIGCSVGKVTLYFADAGFKPREVKAEIFARYMAKPGDYFVVYDDGYQSISPRDVFLAGYHRI